MASVFRLYNHPTTQMKKILSIICTLLCFIIANAYSVDEIPNVHIADRTRFLSNPDNIISPTTQALADSVMADIWNKTSAEVVAVVVNSIDGRNADDFATELFTKWGIGKKDKDNGVLLLVVNDTHDIVIRTGYGAEGALPDIVAGRIIRGRMIPSFRKGDYDAGVIGGLKRIHDVLTDPKNSKELLSDIPNDSQRKTVQSMDDFIASLAMWGTAILVLMLIATAITVRTTRNQPKEKQYAAFKNLTTAALVLTFGGFGIPVIAYLIARHLKNKSRNTPPICPKCQQPMRRVSRQQAFTFLTPVQQTEQNIGSMDYDVWRCPTDGEITVESYPGKNGQYSRCQRCGAKACSVTSRRIIHHPTRFRSGEGEEISTCRHCGNITRRRYSIAKLATPIVAGGRSGRGFGGGFGGGSFGGGMTGGGGASGRW